jgi:ribosomal protein S18 acetylase RimI-like enzyme
MTGLPGLRRASDLDRAAVIALQNAAFGGNRAIMGVEPLPLQADYAAIFRTHEVWLAEAETMLQGALILEPRKDDLYIWSVATAPAAMGRGVGNRLLAAAEQRAAELRRRCIRLRTGEKLTKNIAWYQRHGFVIEQTEQLADRRVVHMAKTLK